MMRTARILLVEPEEGVRRDLNWHLERAGHEVACVPDPEGARVLLEDGLDPDVVVADAGPGADGDQTLRRMAPRAAHLRISSSVEISPEIHNVPDTPEMCSRDPGEVIRRVEEVLLGCGPRPFPDEPSVCLDLVRRLASALPRLRTPEARVDLVVETFDSYFGVIGTLVVRRGASADEWVEAAQGLDGSLSRRLSQEISRRAARRGLRPFLTRLVHDGVSHEVAGLAIQMGEQETDIALALSSPPSEPALRESLISLVGSALRSAMSTDELDRTRAHLDAQTKSFSSLVELSRDFTRVGSRRLLCDAILRALHRELQMTRSALFLPREAGDAMLAPRAVSGFSELLLDRIGLASYHGVGAAVFASAGVLRLSGLPDDGVAARELRRLDEAGLQWAVPLRLEDRTLGVLFFGNREDSVDLEVAERQALQTLLEAAAVSLRNLERVEDLRDLAVCTLQGLVAAGELRRPADRGHAERVARGAVGMGRALGLSPRDLRDLAFASFLHDIGKLASPTDAGAEGSDPRRARLHPVLGSRILSRAKPSAAVVQGVEQHHERFDGHGMPYGLQGAGISLFARILAVADAFDRWTTDLRMTPEEAVRRLELGAGLLFDPGLVAVFAAEVGRNVPAAREPAGEAWLEDIVGAP